MFRHEVADIRQEAAADDSEGDEGDDRGPSEAVGSCEDLMADTHCRAEDGVGDPRHFGDHFGISGCERG